MPDATLAAIPMATTTELAIAMAQIAIPDMLSGSCPDTSGADRTDNTPP
jgi:hypothetical protein